MKKDWQPTLFETAPWAKPKQVLLHHGINTLSTLIITSITNTSSLHLPRPGTLSTLTFSSLTLSHTFFHDSSSLGTTVEFERCHVIEEICGWNNGSSRLRSTLRQRLVTHLSTTPLVTTYITQNITSSLFISLTTPPLNTPSPLSATFSIYHAELLRHCGFDKTVNKSAPSDNGSGRPDTCFVLMKGTRYAKTHADLEERLVRKYPKVCD